MAQAARLLGAKHPERDIDDVVEFEVQFANVSGFQFYGNVARVLQEARFRKCPVRWTLDLHRGVLPLT